MDYIIKTDEKPEIQMFTIGEIIDQAINDKKFSEFYTKCELEKYFDEDYVLDVLKDYQNFQKE